MNRKIIITTFVIAAVGVANAWGNKKPITRVIMGAYIFCLILAILDVFGGPMSTLAGGIAMIALTYIVLHEIPWNTILTAGGLTKKK